MLDAFARRIVDPPLDLTARYLARTGISANALTFTGFAVGLMVLIALANQAYSWALGLILANVLLDGLDGAVARRNGITDLGGYFDVVGDFIFFGAVVLGFALADPETNALAASFLLFSFMGTEASVLAYAAMAEKRHFTRQLAGKKSLYILGGMIEGTETIGLYVLACLLPGWFVWIALAFGVLCWMTIAARAVVAWHTLGENGGSPEAIDEADRAAAAAPVRDTVVIPPSPEP